MKRIITLPYPHIYFICYIPNDITESMVTNSIVDYLQLGTDTAFRRPFYSKK